MAFRKRISLLLCFIVVLCAFLAACSGNDNAKGTGGSGQEGQGQTQEKSQEQSQEQSGGDKKPAEEKHEPVTLTVMNWGGNTDFFDPLYAEFTKK